MLAEQVIATQQLSRWGSGCSKQGHAPRLPKPKQHKQHTQAAATAAAVVVAKGRGSISWEGRIVAE